MTNLACFQGFRQWALEAKYIERKEARMREHHTHRRERIMIDRRIRASNVKSTTGSAQGLGLGG